MKQPVKDGRPQVPPNKAVAQKNKGVLETDLHFWERGANTLSSIPLLSTTENPAYYM